MTARPFEWLRPSSDVEDGLREAVAELGGQPARPRERPVRLWVNQAISGPRQIRAVFALRFGLLGVTICEVSPIALVAGLSASVGLALGRRKRMSWPTFLFQWGRARRSGIISRWYGARLPSARIVSEHPHR